ncbi:MAG TPA: class II glutamine amidotransferase [Actinomycetota bacterium]|nr:class II glutamine amidotransferase [Actinomycetota bacterium]
MCQLLGVAANRPVNIAFSFKEWRHRAAENPDGYGFAFWPRGQLEIVKDAQDLMGAPSSAIERVKTVQSPIFVCHVRYANVGPRDGTNTHPFRDVRGAQEYAFAHNGTVRGIFEMAVSRPAKGKTDSEHAFLWLMDQVSDADDEEFPHALRGAAERVRPLGRFNFLLSDGTTLWAYADDSLYYLERSPPFGGRLVSLEQEGYSIGLDEIKAPDERATLVATELLSDEAGWIRLAKGSLLVVRDGLVDAIIS